MRELFFGFVAGGALAGLLALKKQKAMQARAATARRAFEGQGSALEALVATQGTALQTDLQRAGQAYAPVVAERVARETLAQSYGLTPDRIAAFTRLGERLGG